MTNIAKIDGYKGLVRDLESKAVLNVDSQALNEHRNRKRFMQELLANTEKVNQLENEIGELKEMIRQFMDNR